MTEEQILQVDANLDKAKHTFNRIGWAAFTLMAVWFLFSIFVSGIFGVFLRLGYDVMPFYDRYMLILNELALGIGVAIAMAVLKPLPADEIECEKVGIGRFLKYLTIGFAIGVIGNVIGTGILALWNGITGNEAGGEVEKILGGANYGIMTLCVGFVAPFIEEFFFRKLLIDRLRPFGEKTCIMTSAVLFGLFHGNFTQFFYAAGLGAILAYLYLRSGSLVKVFLYHVVFNLIGGVLPAVLMTMADSPLYYAYVVIYAALIVIGFIFLIANVFSISLKKGEIHLPKRKRLISVLTPGMTAAFLLMLGLMVFSLFSM